jgi:hypothetical protein
MSTIEGCDRCGKVEEVPAEGEGVRRLDVWIFDSFPYLPLSSELPEGMEDYVSVCDGCRKEVLELWREFERKVRHAG